MESRPIRISLKIGKVEVEIECQEKDLKNAVETVFSIVQEKTKQMDLSQARTPKELTGKRKTCKELIVDFLPQTI